MELSKLVPIDVAAAALGLRRAEFAAVALGYFGSADIRAPLGQLLELGVVPGDLVADLIRGSVRDAAVHAA